MFRLYISVVFWCVLSGVAVASTTIEHAQIMLNELGYDAGTADGISGPKTEAALKDFLKSRQINSFEAIELLYDTYQDKTGKTVFDILGKPNTSLSERIESFPPTPFGDIDSLRSVRFEDNDAFYGNFCTSAEININKINSDIGVLMGFIKPNNGGYQTVALDDGNWSSNGMTARGTYTEYVQTHAMNALLEDSPDAVDQLGEMLLKYAEADAFQWYSGSTIYNVIYNDTFGLKSVFAPTIAAWSVLRNIDNGLTQNQVEKIDEWIWNVINRVDFIHQNKPDLSGNRNNQRYQLALNLIQLGLLYKSEYFVHRALFEATRISDEQRPDGSLPLETERGSASLGYTGLATVSLMAIAEYAHILGQDLYSNDETKFLKVFQFFADSVSDLSLITHYAGVQQEELKSWQFGGMTQFCRRYPDTTDCITTGSDLVRYRYASQYRSLELNMGYDGMMNVCTSALMLAAGTNR